MNILWISNYPLPRISEKLGYKPTQNEGWKINLAEELVAKLYNLTIVFPNPESVRVESDEVDGIRFISFPVAKDLKQRNKKINEEKQFLKQILIQVDCDIIHIWGTEFPHSLATMQAAEDLHLLHKVVVSIQGITKECALHYYTGVDYKYIKKQCLIDRYRRKSIYLDAYLMEERGKLEDQVLQKTRNVIGRTDFDKRYISLLNKNANYYICNETLREPFYSGQWNYKSCKPYSIFMSQATYPLKGLHTVLKALSIVKKDCPEVKLYVAGGDILLRSQRNNPIRKLLANHAYTSYLNNLIDEGNLQDNIEMVGVLDPNQMKKFFLNSNIYLLASNIENSPNSLGEAMLLGVPCIAARVGGVMSMCIDNKEVLLYQHDDYYMLASRILELFSDQKLQIFLSENARGRAQHTHNRENNFKKLIEIYKRINSDL